MNKKTDYLKEEDGKVVFDFASLKEDDFKSEDKSSLDSIYDKTYEELKLQQDKRDTLLKIFISLFSFSVPLSLSAVADVGVTALWALVPIYFVVGIVGFIFALIFIRYRGYKESYWISCRTISILKNKIEGNVLDKNLIQIIFVYCLRKAATGFLNKEKRKDGIYEIDKKKFRKKQISSAETLYTLIMSFLAGVLLGVSTGLIIYLLWASKEFNLLALFVSIGAALLVTLFAILIVMKKYIDRLYAVYKVIETNDPKDLKSSFEKAWTLHTYFDLENSK